MIPNLEPTVRKALVEILSSIYETGLVEEVDLGRVLQLFGMEYQEVYMSFRDPGWVMEYMQYKEMIPEDAENVQIIHVEEGDPMAEHIKDHLKTLGIDIDAMEAGLESFEDDTTSLSDQGPKPGEKIH